MAGDERKQSCGEGCGCGDVEEPETEAAETATSGAAASFAGPEGFAAMMARCARMFSGAAAGRASSCGKEA